MRTYKANKVNEICMNEPVILRKRQTFKSKMIRCPYTVNVHALKKSKIAMHDL